VKGKELFEGTTIRLTALKKEDAADMAAWYADAEFMRLFDAATAFPISEEQLASRIEEWHKSETRFVFGLRSRKDERLIGIAGLDEVSWRNRVGWLEIGLGRRHWRQGYGREALRLILGYAFDELDLHKVQLTVFSYNRAAQRLYECFRFRREGVFREYVYRDGERHDMILMGLLAREWREGCATGEKDEGAEDR